MIGLQSVMQNKYFREKLLKNRVYNALQLIVSHKIKNISEFIGLLHYPYGGYMDSGVVCAVVLCSAGLMYKNVNITLSYWRKLD